MKSRRHSADKREIIPDPKFGNVVISKFMNSIMHAGKKSVAEAIVYGALDIDRGQDQAAGSDHRVPAGARQRDAVDRGAFAARRRAPPIRCRSRCAPSRRQALGIRWIISAARDRNEKTHDRAALRRAARRVEQQGNAVKKREDTHRMAEANRAFSHYRW